MAAVASSPTPADILHRLFGFPGFRGQQEQVVTRVLARQRALAIMAAVERGEGSDEAVVRGWLSRALTAPRGPQWCCDKCQAIHAIWQPICENCGGFDTLSWRDPVETSGQSATGAELLPLLVGQPKAAEVEDDVIDLAPNQKT